MKNIITLLIAITVISFNLSAQKKRAARFEKETNDERKHQGHKREMLKDLDLSDAQKTQIKSYREEYKRQMQALREDPNLTVKEINSRRDALKQHQKAKIHALLTNEQKKKIEKNKLEHKADANMRAEKKLEKMKSKLSLSDDQANKLRAQRERTRGEIKVIKENQSLDAVSKKQQITEIKNTAKQQRKSILTPDQLKRLEEAKVNSAGKERRRSGRFTK